MKGDALMEIASIFRLHLRTALSVENTIKKILIQGSANLKIYTVKSHKLFMNWEGNLNVYYA